MERQRVERREKEVKRGEAHDESAQGHAIGLARPG